QITTILGQFMLQLKGNDTGIYLVRRGGPSLDNSSGVKFRRPMRYDSIQINSNTLGYEDVLMSVLAYI
ncbi:MAG: hypothetical protein ACRD8W_26065, partial [Nitrososphaeraceae archaeon]